MNHAEVELRPARSVHLLATRPQLLLSTARGGLSTGLTSAREALATSLSSTLSRTLAGQLHLPDSLQDGTATHAVRGIVPPERPLSDFP